MLPEPTIESLRRHWPADEPATDLADRIIANAMLHKQQRSWRARLRDAFALPAMDRSFAMKGLAFAACVMIAVVVLEPTSKTVSPTKKLPSSTMERIVEDMIWSDYSY